MKTTVTKLRRTIRRVIRESSDWYSDEHETLADKKFADEQRYELGPGIPGDDTGVLMISGGGEKFAITNTGDYFSVSVYDDDFRDAFISKLEQAREQGYEQVQLASGPMNTEYLTIDEMMQRVEEIEASMY